MKCPQSRPGFELVSPSPFPTTITVTPGAPPLHFQTIYCQACGTNKKQTTK